MKFKISVDLFLQASVYYGPAFAIFILTLSSVFILFRLHECSTDANNAGNIFANSAFAQG
jgi:hypothetical protein